MPRMPSSHLDCTRPRWSAIVADPIVWFAAALAAGLLVEIPILAARLGAAMGG